MQITVLKCSVELILSNTLAATEATNVAVTILDDTLVCSAAHNANIINNIILNISQSNIFGNSIIETMYNQVDYLREKYGVIDEVFEEEYQDFEEKYFSYNKGRNYALELEKIGITILDQTIFIKDLIVSKGNFTTLETRRWMAELNVIRSFYLGEGDWLFT